jgi:hypothetical protein
LLKEIAVTKIFLMAAIRAVIVLLAWPFAALAHDHSRPELNSWFESLKSGKGPCCSDADGTALSDTDWEARDGHYRVREPMVRRPGRCRDQAAEPRGPTVVWPFYDWTIGKALRIDIRCFIPEAMM